MGMIKASARVASDLDAQFAAALKNIEGDVDAVLREVAQEVGFEARRSAAFEDYKRTPRESKHSRKNRSRSARNLRSTIKMDVSKFENGGYIVTARAPHAHLVEFGHLLVLKDKNGIVRVAGHVPAHPFLRPALDAARARLIAKLQAMKGARNG